MTENTDQETWFKALEADELEEGRVKAVTIEHLTLCMTHKMESMARKIIAAPIKADRWERARSRRDIYAVRGMDGTTAR